jgi:hypothetical protein
MASITPAAPELVPGTSRAHHTFASICPPSHRRVLSPGGVNQWLALPQGPPNWCQAHDEDTALLLASAPRVTTKCLSPGRVSQWLALPQGPPNWCQAHDERTALLLASAPQVTAKCCPQVASTNG